MNSLPKLVLALAVVTTGCAARHSTSNVAATATTHPAPLVGDAMTPEMLPLDQILPAPLLEAPATQPDSRPPVDALVHYANGRAALLDGRRQTAINEFGKAAQLDPHSFEVFNSLGEAYLGGNIADGDSIDAFLKAAAIRPDDLHVRIQLGRQFMVKGNFDGALRQLRLAIQTSEYARDDDQSAVTDYFLARALQQKGFDRAALDRYQILLTKLENPSLELRGNPELAMLVSRPEMLYLQIGQLYEKHKEYDEALKMYEPAAEQDPANFDLQAKVVRTLAAAGKRDEAGQRAAEIVTKFRADAQSLALMREVYKSMGKESAVIDELKRLRADRPDDRALLFTEADVMKSMGRDQEAKEVLADAWKKNPADIEVLRRLYSLYDQKDDTTGGARVIVQALAVDPDILREIMPMWADLIRSSRRNRLTIATLQRMEVPSDAEAARQFFVSRMADLWNRDLLARSALERAAKGKPPMAPAYRLLFSEIWNRADWDDKQKIDATEKLAQQADEGGAPALAEEIRGLSLVSQKQPQKGAELLADAVTKSSSPELRLNYAAVLRASGDRGKAETVLWKIIGDRPGYDDAYIALVNMYLEAGSQQQALHTIDAWLAADPNNIGAQLLNTRRLPGPAAFAVVDRLLAEHGDDPQVLNGALAIYSQSGRINDYIRKLEDIRTKHPENRTVVEQLVDIYAAQSKTADAIRVLDAARSAVKGDPDLMYYVAHLYERVGQNKTTEEILGEILRIDPRNAPAANDLGYTLADGGRDLDRAETLIRIAVEEEPDNQAFLDSLGWVLYKRGKFEEAAQRIEQAVGPAQRPDAVIVDHLGDTLYRLGKHDEALKQWKRSLERDTEELQQSDREDLTSLRLELQTKIKAAEAKQPVIVAPVAENK